MPDSFDTLTIDGLRTAYRSFGVGTPIVFVHGVGLSSEVWAPQIEAFVSSHRVLVYDTYGHGNSSLPPEEVKLETYVRQLEGLLDEVDIERAAVVGHSMGAMIATAFAEDHPDRVDGLVALHIVYDRTPESRAVALERAEQLRTSGPESVVDSTIARWFGEEMDHGQLPKAQALRNWLSAADPVGYSRAYQMFAESDQFIVGRLDALDMPALFLTGELDPNSTPAMSRRMAEESPRGRAIILDGERHMAPYVSPELVNQPLNAFLNELVRPGH